ncbi:uncharacterized protein LOC131840638 [Achroia grisella]|uniref:uncharacterized protein LOC131840638 n=1 Tax=Achroia grisella TaxID=688607 RepID=UPI0027D22308|nr:uncharacterized protein LOC131840638 [Achroia grisella]
MENITQASEPTELPISDTSLITERTTPLYCKTGKGLSGECVERKRCDFSTSNIDFTLYRPHRKPRPCEPKEVCCPFDFVLPLAPPSYEEEIIDFDNDD